MSRYLLDSPPESDSRLVVLNRIVSYTLLGVFFAGITYIIINFIRHCLLRCQPSESIVIRLQHNRQSTTCEPNLAIQSQLDAIPVLIYGNSLDYGTGSEEACSVCLGEYVAGENVRVMPKCRHMFHRECIDRWLTTRSAFCPICRGCVVESNNMNDEGCQQRLEVPVLEIQVVPPTRIL